MKPATAVVFSLVVFASSTVSRAESVEACPADKYKPCTSFRTSRAIQDHTPIIESHTSGFARSKGSWKVFVGYGPSETCAKVSLTMDMGPVDVDRTYDRVFHRGGGVIGDSGSFMHKLGDVESGLRILTSSCRVPDGGSRRLDADAEERRELERARERLALQEERERLALEEQRERLELESERDRVAVETAREKRNQEARLAQIRRAREAEREQQRLALEANRRDEAQARMRRAELERARERERLAEQQRALEQADDLRAVAGFLGGLSAGLAELNRGGSAGTAAGTAVSETLRKLGTSTDSPTDWSAGSSATVGDDCTQAQRRAEQRLRVAQNQSVGGMGICDTARHYVSTLQAVRGALASGGCPAHALRQYDQAIAQARQTAFASCS